MQIKLPPRVSVTLGCPPTPARKQNKHQPRHSAVANTQHSESKSVVLGHGLRLTDPEPSRSGPDRRTGSRSEARTTRRGISTPRLQTEHTHSLPRQSPGSQGALTLGTDSQEKQRPRTSTRVHVGKTSQAACFLTFRPGKGTRGWRKVPFL